MIHARATRRVIRGAVLAGSLLWAVPLSANPASTQSQSCRQRSAQLLAQLNSDITGTNINQGPPSILSPTPTPPPPPPPTYSGPPPSQISQQLQQTLESYQQAEARALSQPRRFSRSREAEECINPFAEQLESLLQSGQNAVQSLSGGDASPSPDPTGGDGGSGSRLW